MRKYFNKAKRNNTEEGLTLVEILVAVSLLALVSVMVVTLINTTMSSASRFGNVTATQGEISRAVNLIQTDISSATKVTSASDNAITMEIRQANQNVRVTYFYYKPGTDTTIPAGVDKASLPGENGNTYIVQVRETLNNDGSVARSGSSIIAKAVNPATFADKNDRHTFDYYDETNTRVTAVPKTTDGTATPSSDLAKISRVQFRISAAAAGRGTPIQLESSATVNTSKVTPGVRDETYSGVPECPTNLITSAPNASGVGINPREITLNWYSPSGATSYTIYVTNVTNGASTPMANIVIPDPSTLTTKVNYVNNGITWGNTYRFEIQANGTAGTSARCGATEQTIIPSSTTFVNINSLASKGVNAATSVTRAADTNIPAKTVETDIYQSGQYYTTADGKTNQLSWRRVTGATTYIIYPSSTSTTPIATVGGSNNYFQLSADFGDVTNYVVRGANSQGQSAASPVVTLISPPRATAVTVTDPDTSTSSTNSSSVIRIGTKAANTDGFRVAEGEANVDSASFDDVCTAASQASATKSLTFSPTDTSRTDTTAAWGSVSCYELRPYNDAGEGEPSQGRVLHKPGKFGITSMANAGTMRVIDDTKDSEGGDGGLSLPFCWADPNRQVQQGINCKGGEGHRADAYYPLGLFGKVDNQYTKIELRWSEAYGSTANYSIERDRLSTGTANIDQHAAKVYTRTAPWVDGTQGLNYNYEMPGSVYEFTVTAKSRNGQSRAVSNQMVTRPDIPSSMRGIYYVKSYQEKASRIVLTVGLKTIRGKADQIEVRTTVPRKEDGVVNKIEEAETKTINGSTVNFNSRWQNVPGKNYRKATTILTETINGKSVTVKSGSIGRHGELTGFACPSSTAGACNTPNGISQITSGYPLWWTGKPSRYWAGGEPHTAANVTVSSNAAITLPDDIALDSEEGGSGNDCSVTLETSPEFTDGECAPGTGIPGSPTISSTQSGTNHTFTWPAQAGVTSYEVEYTVNGGTATVMQQNATSRSVVVSAPVGQRINFSVTAINPNSPGAPGTRSVVTAPGVPSGVTATADGSSAVVNWNQVSGATGYRVTYTGNGTTNTVNVTNTTARINNLAAGQYSIRVQATAGGASSGQSSVALVTIEEAEVPIVSSVNAVKGTGTQWNIDFVHNGGTVSYSYRVTGPNSYLLESNSFTRTDAAGTVVNNLPFTAASNGTYTISINAYNPTGVGASSTYTRTLNVQTTMTAPPTPTSVTTGAVTGGRSVTYTPGGNAASSEIIIVDSATNKVVQQLIVPSAPAGAARTATVTGIPSGTYVAKVRSLSADGVTSPWATSAGFTV